MNEDPRADSESGLLAAALDGVVEGNVGMDATWDTSDELSGPMIRLDQTANHGVGSLNALIR
jgi:hypothetical protein